jgi:hypothetical protein
MRCALPPRISDRLVDSGKQALETCGNQSLLKPFGSAGDQDAPVAFASPGVQPLDRCEAALVDAPEPS